MSARQERSLRKDKPVIIQLLVDRLQAQGDDRGVVSVRQLPTGGLVWSSEEHVERHSQSVTALAWSRDGRYLASGSSDTTVKVWDAGTGRLLQTYTEHTAEICALAWSSQEERIVSSAIHEHPHIWTPLISSVTSC